MIPIAKPSLGEAEVEAAGEVILSGWVTQGPRVQAFERAFAEYVGAAHACAVSNCTSALHLALLAVGVKPGDVVITVSHSFIATANAVRCCGAEPVFVDIEPQTFNLDPVALERFLSEQCERRDGALTLRDPNRLARGESPLALLTPERRGRVAAIMPVHQMGMPCDLSSILPIAAAHDLPVVEDAACGVGSQWRAAPDAAWERVGRPHGDVACFSFHPRKVLTTGDGGMLTTNNAEHDARFRLLRAHAMNVPATERHGADTIVVERYETTAFNYRMTDIQAAVGLVQLGRLPRFVDQRRAIDKRYREALAETPWLLPPVEPHYARSNWQSYALTVADDAPISRDDLLRRLLSHGVAAKPGIMNAHAEAPYRREGVALRCSEKARAQVILIPMFGHLEDAQIERVCEVLCKH